MRASLRGFVDPNKRQMRSDFGPAMPERTSTGVSTGGVRKPPSAMPSGARRTSADREEVRKCFVEVVSREERAIVRQPDEEMIVCLARRCMQFEPDAADRQAFGFMKRVVRRDERGEGARIHREPRADARTVHGSGRQAQTELFGAALEERRAEPALLAHLLVESFRGPDRDARFPPD